MGAMAEWRTPVLGGRCSLMQRDFVFFEQMAEGLHALQQIKQIEYQYHQRVCVYQCDKLKLYHYQQISKKKKTIPLLIVYATINRPEILDLFNQYSVIGELLEKGMDIYLLDWGYPDAQDYSLSLNDYVTHYLDGCVNFIIEKTQEEKINLLGICQGGLLSLCYASLFQKIKQLILISTPIDFHTKDNKITNLVKHMDMRIFKNKNVPGAWLTQFFISLRLFELTGKKYLNFIDHLSDPVLTERFLRVEKWLHDAPDQAGRAFSEFIHSFYKKNQFKKINHSHFKFNGM